MNTRVLISACASSLNLFVHVSSVHAVSPAHPLLLLLRNQAAVICWLGWQLSGGVPGEASMKCPLYIYLSSRTLPDHSVWGPRLCHLRSMFLKAPMSSHKQLKIAWMGGLSSESSLRKPFGNEFWDQIKTRNRSNSIFILDCQSSISIWHNKTCFLKLSYTLLSFFPFFPCASLVIIKPHLPSSLLKYWWARPSAPRAP